jgi:sporulation protein YlmC with PRC-barrel domain
MTMTTPDAASTRRLILSTRTLIGSQVENTGGQSLGHVRELMIDVPSGTVVYAVVALNGTQDSREKLFAVPWSALRLNHQNKVFLLEMSKQRLDEALGFDQHHWPDMADAAWSETIEEYYRVSSPQRYDG